MKLDIIFMIVAGIFVIYYFINSSCNNTEHFDATSDAKAAVNAVYQADVGAIRTLADVAGKLQAGTLTVPGNLQIGPNSGHPFGVTLPHGDWQSRFYNTHNNTAVYMAHGAGYGMHINAQNNGKGTYVLECHNGNNQVLGVYGNNNVNVTGTLNVSDNAQFGPNSGHPFGVSYSTGDWQARYHNPTSGTYVYMGHGAKYGMHINANNSGKDTYVLECHNGNNQVLGVYGNNKVNVTGTLNVNGSLTINDINTIDMFPIIMNFSRSNVDETLYTYTLNQKSVTIITWAGGNDGNYQSLLNNSRARFAALGMRNHAKVINDFRDYNDMTITVPPGKVVKMWRWDGEAPLICNAGYHDFNSRSSNGPHFIWAGLASNYEHFPDSIRMAPPRFPW